MDMYILCCECVQFVSQVNNISSTTFRSKLTHGLVQKVLKSGRVADQWLGAGREVAKRVDSTSCHGIIDRNGEILYDL